MKFDLVTVYRLEQEVLNSQLNAMRAAIEHRGEKGTVLESYARKFLRDALPAEFGISTGFIAFPPTAKNGAATLSDQLDIIIYDALHGSPLVRLPTCDVFPLESVLGYVEVKAQITGGSARDKKSIRTCVGSAQKVRKHTTRWFHVATAANTSVVYAARWASVRSYVFAYEGPKNAADKLSAATKALGEHAELTGLFINNSAYLCSAPAQRPKVEVIGTKEDALVQFRHALLTDLARMRWSPGLGVHSRDGKQHGVITNAYLTHYLPARLAR